MSDESNPPTESLPDLSQAFVHSLMVVRDLGGNPVLFAQGFFNAVWDSIPHVIPMISDRQRAAINGAIENRVNKILSETN